MQAISTMLGKEILKLFAACGKDWGMKNELTAAFAAKQIAARLDRPVAARTVRLWCKDGRFPNARLVDHPLGDYWVIPETDVKAFVPPEMGRPATKPKANGAAKKPAAKKGGKR